MENKEQMERALPALDELIGVAKREKNKKRSYLYVNRQQGKHVPVSPSLPFALFSRLAERVESLYGNERILVIGFAETATAIGGVIAYRARNVRYYMNTTREEVPGAEYLFFTESHSHASEQRLVSSGIAEVLEETDRVVFAEDEVTTGKTIAKLIRLLRGTDPRGRVKYTVCSIVNSMPESRIAEFRGEGTDCLYLYKMPAGYRVDETGRYTYLTPNTGKTAHAEDGACGLCAEEYAVEGICNTRVLTESGVFRERCEAFARKAAEIFGREAAGIHKCKAAGMPEREAAEKAARGEPGLSVLVLGTEEFMFPAMLAACFIEKMPAAAKVSFHATTRSPIEISADAAYPLHARVSLGSFYESGRRNFLYNLERYDCVLVMTDADPVCAEGPRSLIRALTDAGNRRIAVLRWVRTEDREE